MDYVVTGLCLAGGFTILTPAGVPLLLAGVLLTGAEVQLKVNGARSKFTCQPNVIADRIILLHAALSYLSRMTAQIDMVHYETGLGIIHGKRGRQIWSDSRNEDVPPLAERGVNLPSFLSGPVINEGDFGLGTSNRLPTYASSAIQKLRSHAPCAKSDYLMELSREASTQPPKLTETLECELQLALHRHQEKVEQGMDYSLPCKDTLRQIMQQHVTSR